MLERLAKNSRSDRIMIAAILAAFIGVKAPWPVGAPVDTPPHPTPDVEPLPWLDDRAADVQAAAAVLGRRPVEPDEPHLALSRVDLRRSYLSRAHLARVNLRHANLAGSWLLRIVLDDADLVAVDLRDANLHDASCARRSSARRACTGPTCGSPGWRASLLRASLHGADLRGADLRGADQADAELTDARADATARWPEGFSPPKSVFPTFGRFLLLA